MLALNVEGLDQLFSGDFRLSRDGVNLNANRIADVEGGGHIPQTDSKRNHVTSPVYADKYLRQEGGQITCFSEERTRPTDLMEKLLGHTAQITEVSYLPTHKGKLRQKRGNAQEEDKTAT